MTDKPDIIQTAQALGCLPEKQSGYGGNCPAKHESENGRCFHIYEETQSFFCFHCRAGGGDGPGRATMTSAQVKEPDAAPSLDQRLWRPWSTFRWGVQNE